MSIKTWAAKPSPKQQFLASAEASAKSAATYEEDAAKATDPKRKANLLGMASDSWKRASKSAWRAGDGETANKYMTNSERAAAAAR